MRGKGKGASGGEELGRARKQGKLGEELNGRWMVNKNFADRPADSRGRNAACKLRAQSPSTAGRMPSSAGLVAGTCTTNTACGFSSGALARLSLGRPGRWPGVLHPGGPTKSPKHNPNPIKPARHLAALVAFAGLGGCWGCAAFADMMFLRFWGRLSAARGRLALSPQLLLGLFLGVFVPRVRSAFFTGA